MTPKIDIRPIKARALAWPEPTKTLILAEPDKMRVEEFLVKIGTWERLLKIHEVK